MAMIDGGSTYLIDTTKVVWIKSGMVDLGKGSSTERDRKILNKLVQRASLVLDCPLDSIEMVDERRMLSPQPLDCLTQALPEQSLSTHFVFSVYFLFNLMHISLTLLPVHDE